MKNASIRIEKYGRLPEQEGDLYLPHQPHPPVVCLLHGGFWRMPHGRDQLNAIAGDLALRGFAVWNLEYRRLGVPTAGWPGTFDDVLAGIRHLAHMAADGVDMDLERVTVCGHSAGGHLALWSAAQLHGEKGAVRICAAVGQAPLADLTRTYELGVGGRVVEELLGGTPEEHPDLYRAASPHALLPLGVRQLILHGTRDDAVPIEISRSYAQAARNLGDNLDLAELPDTGHMEYLEPASVAHDALCNWLTQVTAAAEI